MSLTFWNSHFIWCSLLKGLDSKLSSWFFGTSLLGLATCQRYQLCMPPLLLPSLFDMMKSFVKESSYVDFLQKYHSIKRSKHKNAPSKLNSFHCVHKINRKNYVLSNNVPLFWYHGGLWKWLVYQENCYVRVSKVVVDHHDHLTQSRYEKE